MENEINKLKKEYDQASPPIFLVENGIHDLWRRVNNQNKYFNSKMFKYVMLGMLALLVSSGLIGAVSTQATADSALYPIKILTQKAVSTISNATLDTINKSQEIINKNVHPKPDSSKPTIALEEKKKDTEEEKENTEDAQIEDNDQDQDQEQNSKNEEVEGASVSELNKNEDSSSDFHEDNDSVQENESEDKSHENK